MKSVEIVSYSFLEPLFGILFSVIVMGETLTLIQIIGGILVAEIKGCFGGSILEQPILSGRNNFLL